MDEACRVMGNALFWSGNLREKDHFRDIGTEWADHIKIDLQEMDCEGVEQIRLAENRVHFKFL
jgi:hypothetical protein